VSAQFDVRGAQRLNIKVSGIKSDRVDQDELIIAMEDVELLQERQSNTREGARGTTRVIINCCNWLCNAAWLV
jgi:hypothetical protein